MPAFPSAVFNNEVLYEVRDDGVAVITLNAPQRLNTIGRKMASGVQHALDLASEDSTVRAVVLTASGTRAFCVGGNLASDDDGAATGFKGRPGDAVPPTTAAAVRLLTLTRTLTRTLTLTLTLTLALTPTLTRSGLGFPLGLLAEKARCTVVHRSLFVQQNCGAHVCART